MRSSRVLLVDLPRLTRALITELLAGRSGITIVGESSGEELRDALARTRANVVILAVEDERVPDAVERLLEERRLRVVVLTNRGRSSTVAELAPISTDIEELTSESLAAVLAGAAG